MSALGISFAKQVKASPTLYKMLLPVASRLASFSGWRQVGLKYDDILIEENDTVQTALGRLSERQSYDRAFRLRQASQCSIAHADLPKAQWVKPEEDVRYLKPLVKEVEEEVSERTKWDVSVRK
ncbi:hypothetical protein JCM11251_004458 [Rhodosporidiobolus azoricus]